jgi:hypothetical protein
MLVFVFTASIFVPAATCDVFGAGGQADDFLFLTKPLLNVNKRLGIERAHVSCQGR